MFYSMLVERWCERGNKFDSRRFPVTQMLKRKLREGTDNIQDFVRDKFVLKNRDIDMSFKEFWHDYKSYCSSRTELGPWKSKPFPKSQLSERLEKREKFVRLCSVKPYESGEVRFALIKMRLDKGKDNKTLMIKARHSDLLERWKAQHYLHETDEAGDDENWTSETETASDSDSDDTSESESATNMAKLHEGVMTAVA